MPETVSHPTNSPAAAPSVAGQMSRRSVFALAAAGALTMAGCGPVRVGGPAEYTPPPPGIDDLYRLDLLALLDRAVASVDLLRQESGPSDEGGADTPADPQATDPQVTDPQATDPQVSTPQVTEALEALAASLPVQRRALMTGAQLEREQEQSEDPDPHLDPTPAPSGMPTDLAGLVSLLVELRELCVDASRQVSGSLARPVCATGTHVTWAAARLRNASGQGEVPAPRPTAAIEPTRAVPEQDPPSIGAESDYHTYIESAQEQEWYAAYVHEVLAAATEDAVREQHLTAVETHRARAESLLAIAEEDGAPQVTRQAVYPLPGGTLTDSSIAQLPTMLADGLLTVHVALVGAAPFERRAVAIEAAMTEATVLSLLVAELDPLPSLEPDDPPAGE